jgi:hypothetical protein
MTEKEAIERASEFARARGRDAGRYKASAELSEGEWRVDFRPDGKNIKTRPGDFFTVYVEDGSGEARMFEGK